MNITTIRDNLVNTIAGKEKYLAELRKKHSQLGVSAAVASYVEINIDELKRILQDVEQCRPEWTPNNCPYAANETCHRMD